MPGPIEISFDDIEFIDADTTALRSDELRGTLAADPGQATAFLSEKVTPVNVSDLRIDEDGRIIVEGANFAEVLRDHSYAEVHNAVCGAGC